METIKKLIERKKQGIDCTEEESAEIKQYILTTYLMTGDDTMEIDRELQNHFPLEWSEAQDMIEQREIGTEHELECSHCGWKGNEMNLPIAFVSLSEPEKDYRCCPNCNTDSGLYNSFLNQPYKQ